MKIKKLLSFVLSITLLLSFAGCTEDKSPEVTSSTTSKNSEATTTKEIEKTSKNKIVMVWYPNESAKDYEPARNEFGRLIEKATGKKVEQKLTTDGFKMDG